MSSLARKTILKTHRIDQYLAGRNINPIRSTSERKCYKCPFHNEKDGSFFVYDHGDHEDYHCFGCKAHGDIITLVAKLEDISYKDAVTRLSEGLKIDLQSELDSIVREIILLQNDPLSSLDPLDLSFFISHICYEYLVKVEFDPEEVACCEKLFVAVDKMVYSLEVKNLNEVHESIRSTLSKRIEMFRQKQMQKRLEALKSSEAYRNIV